MHPPSGKALGTALSDKGVSWGPFKGSLYSLVGKCLQACLAKPLPRNCSVFHFPRQVSPRAEFCLRWGGCQREVQWGRAVQLGTGQPPHPHLSLDARLGLRVRTGGLCGSREAPPADAGGSPEPRCDRESPRPSVCACAVQGQVGGSGPPGHFLQLGFLPA